MTSVLVVDDSRLIRKLVGTALAERGYEVGSASDGHEAVELVETCDPDVVTMDVEMPGMSGIETVERIMEVNPTPIVMLSAHTATGAEATMRALARGAVDFIQKPTGETDIDDLERELVATVEAVKDASEESLSVQSDSPAVGGADSLEASEAIEEAYESIPDQVFEPEDESEGGETTGADAAEPTAGASGTGGTDSPLGGRARPDRSRESGAETDAGTESAPAPGSGGGGRGATAESTEPSGRSGGASPGGGHDRATDPVPTVVVGASTGGPNVVETVVSRLPASMRARVLIVQHMPPSFTGRLAGHLNDVSEYDVSEATDGATVGPGEALVARGDYHMRAVDREGDRLRVALSQDDPVHNVRPSIDVTMRSVAHLTPPPSPLVGVVLTGMGEDGAGGIEAVSTAGGATFVQDEATSPVFSMPRNAIETGRVDDVLPPASIPGAIHSAVEDLEQEAHA